MPRYRLTLEYDGALFVGWQRQDNGPSVQGALEEAIFKLSGETVTVTGAVALTGVYVSGCVQIFTILSYRCDHGPAAIRCVNDSAGAVTEPHAFEHEPAPGGQH